ncbi:DUF2382 domain-containing protein [Waterburya agarophytonicola K14]|uniref:DUF2382 domain-containing protein n=1 Tax=Waterburya agarophytonicola KI4 TaxID=2874699 RepID=A0A964FEL8_9CYAN|nr:DUF2382 domain-containing protein [Waterburya agarophytonicola]MCC0176830.1 DUF2382 domain-containing protein [Waterburya agarophytonicola KI4]
MVLAKIADLYPDYKQDVFGGEDIKSFSVYDYQNDKIGSVYDILVDETGRFRYLVIDTGFWIFGKKVLLPIGRASVDYSQERVYAKGLTKEEAENLPEYDDDMTVDYDYEERVRTIYRGVDYDADNTVYAQEAGGYDSGAYNKTDSYAYDREPSLYAHQEVDDRQNLKLYEERLVANKDRFVAGAVTIGKRVETETATVSVPIEKERLIVERTTPTDTTAVTPGEASFNAGEVARVEMYEETADIEKQAFVREEVSIRKEVEKDVVSAKETIRREELDVETDGDAVVNNNL